MTRRKSKYALKDLNEPNKENVLENKNFVDLGVINMTPIYESNNEIILENKNFVDLGVLNMTPTEDINIIPVRNYRYDNHDDLNSRIDKLESIINEYVLLSENIKVGVNKLYNDSKIPEYATDESNCFDMYAYLDLEKVKAYSKFTSLRYINTTKIHAMGNEKGIYIRPGECAYIPTGLKFDIPFGYKMLIYPRSGLSSKKHLKLANSVAVIDSDYVEEVFILLINDSGIIQPVIHNERIAQAEIVPSYKVIFNKINKITTKTNRKGGFGSTG